MDKTKIAFVNLFAEFYEQFFLSTSESVDLLANLQEKYKEEYESIKLFGKDPDAIEKLINELPDEKQAILLKILLKAGKFGKDMANLFESSVEEKRKLSGELKKFGENLSLEIKKDLEKTKEITKE